MQQTDPARSKSFVPPAFISAQPTLDKRRIAVLPLQNISPDPKDEYLADGMTEELISTMSRIGGLKVIARTSVMRYKGGGKGIDEIARELMVGSILEGSVRKAGEKLRITVQLIDSMSSDHIWSESYDRELKDVFEIQADISKTVAEALKVQLKVGEKERIEKEPTKSTEAHTMCLKGIYYNMDAVTEAETRKAIKCLERAVELDPSYALAYASLSDAYSYLAWGGFLSLAEVLPRAEKAATKALELDPDLAEAHNSLAYTLYLKLDWRGCEDEVRKALELNPNSAYGHVIYAMLLSATGRLDEAGVEAKRALELDPISRPANWVMYRVFYFNRQYDRSIEHLKKMREFDPDFSGIASGLGFCYLQKALYDEAIAEFQKTVDPSKGKADLAFSELACAYAKSGRREEAVRILNDYEEISKNQFIPAYAMVRIHLALGQKDEAIERLEKAYDEREYSSLDGDSLKVNPIYDDLQSDPRFIALLKKVGLEK